MSERGVKETKEVLAFVFSMANAIKISLADGDFDFWDAKNFVEPLKKIAPAVENIDEVLPELEDLLWDEILELAKYSMTELGLGGDINIASEVESAAEQVEEAIDMGRSLLKLVGNIG
tara:strand:- start:12 stop:365 length:354 start_codon:yes stop_codon:yes gene_type:complete